MDFREEKIKKKKKKGSVLVVILSMIVMFSITLCGFLLFSYINQKNKTIEIMAKIEKMETMDTITVI